MNFDEIPVVDNQLAGIEIPETDTQTPENCTSIPLKTCEDCTEYLLCKKAKLDNSLNTICEKFENNFPDDIDDITEFEESLESEEDCKDIQVICNGFKSNICDGCPHAISHSPFEYFIEDDSCTNSHFCEDAGKDVNCEEICT
jgi:hypothetical protein